MQISRTSSPTVPRGAHVRFTALHDRPLSGIWNWDFADSSRILAVSLLSRLREPARGQGWDITSHTHRHKMNRIGDAGAHAFILLGSLGRHAVFFFSLIKHADRTSSVVTGFSICSSASSHSAKSTFCLEAITAGTSLGNVLFLSARQEVHLHKLTQSEEKKKTPAESPP